MDVAEIRQVGRGLFSLADRAMLQGRKRRARFRSFRGSRLAIDSSAHGPDSGKPLVSQQGAGTADRPRASRRRGRRFFPTGRPTTIVRRTPSKASRSTRFAMLWPSGFELGPWGGLRVNTFWSMPHGRSVTPETVMPPPRSAIARQPWPGYEKQAST